MTKAEPVGAEARRQPMKSLTGHTMSWAIFFMLACRAAPNVFGQTPGDSPDYPEPRGYAQLVASPETGKLILFGGESNSRFSYESTWAYDVSANGWKKYEADPHPSNAGGTAAAFDVESNRLVVYFTTRLDRSASNGLVRLSETWAFDPSDGTWTNMHPDPAPFGLMGSRAAYDAESDRIILFGGADFTRENPEWFSATWAYDFDTNTWTELHPRGAPPGRSYFAMTYDAVADRVLAFAGSPADAAASMWSFDYNANAWEEIRYRGEVQPDHHPFMAYAPAVDKTYYMVGDSFSAFDFETRTWTALPRDPNLGDRHFLAMAVDDKTGKLVVFGGGERGLHYDNSTWVFDPVAWSWTLAGPRD